MTVPQERTRTGLVVDLAEPARQVAEVAETRALDRGITVLPSWRASLVSRRTTGLMQMWCGEAVQTGREIKRIAVAYQASRDGFWLAWWLRVHDIEAYVIHPSSVAVSREHRRAKTDRLDTECARLPRVAPWREAPLQHGGDPDNRG